MSLSRTFYLWPSKPGTVDSPAEVLIEFCEPFKADAVYCCKVNITGLDSSVPITEAMGVGFDSVSALLSAMAAVGAILESSEEFTTGRITLFDDASDLDKDPGERRKYIHFSK
jgi:hypothetical protein